MSRAGRDSEWTDTESEGSRHSRISRPGSTTRQPKRVWRRATIPWRQKSAA
jgi:hypothetical protein